MLALSSCKESNKVDRLWDSYLKSMGNMEDLKNVKSFVYRSKTEYPMGMLTEKVWAEYPDKVRYDVRRPDGGTELILINGTRGMQIIDGDTNELGPDQLCPYKNFGMIFPEIYYREQGYSMTQFGSQENDGTFKILINTECGELIFVFDEKTEEFIGLNPKGYNLMVRVLEKDIVRGVQIAKRSSNISNGDTLYTYFDQHEVNPVLSDSLFRLE